MKNSLIKKYVSKNAIKKELKIFKGINIFKDKNNVSDNFILIKVKKAKLFKLGTFRIKVLSKSKGINIVTGKTIKGKKAIQSYLFDLDKKKWTVKKAQKWVKENKVINKKVTNKVKTESFKIYFEIAKIDTDKRLVTGPLLVPEKIDAHDDIISAADIETAAHEFLKYHEPIDTMHLNPNHKIDLVESWISPVDFKLKDRKVIKGTWIATVFIADDEVWQAVKDKKLNGFSIQGRTEYEEEEVVDDE